MSGQWVQPFRQGIIGSFFVRARVPGLFSDPKTNAIKTARLGIAPRVLVAAEANRRKPMDSRAGNAINAPAPRRKDRRLNSVFI